MLFEHLANIVQNTEYVVPEDSVEELPRAALSLRSLPSAHTPGVLTKARILIKHKHVLGAQTRYSTGSQEICWMLDSNECMNKYKKCNMCIPVFLLYIYIYI